MSKFLPFKTAPQDGTEFLILMEGAVYKARYFTEGWKTPQLGVLSHHPGTGPHYSLWASGWEFKPSAWAPVPEVSEMAEVTECLGLTGILQARTQEEAL